MYNYHAVITGLSKPTLFKQTVMIILIQLKRDHTVTLLRVCWQVVTYPELSLFLLGPFSGLLTARNDIGNFVNAIKSEEEITQTCGVSHAYETGIFIYIVTRAWQQQPDQQLLQQQ